MDHFEYRNGILHCESVDLVDLAGRHGTPLYVYSRQTILDHYGRLATAFAEVDPWLCFSIKSCGNLSILKLLRQQGCAFDVVSGGEVRRALEAGADPARIVFAGVGKSDEEINHALDVGVGYFNVESEAEMDNLASRAAAAGKTASAALRVNPDVDPKTHVYTTTGKRETKFGVDVERARNVFKTFHGRKGLNLDAIHLHIGSPVNDVSAYVESITKGLRLIDDLRGDGYTIRSLNIGGGYGADYETDQAPPAMQYAGAIVPLLRGHDLKILLEPGRTIMGNAGVLLCRTLYTKASGDKQFVIVDGSMTELIRPCLYGAFHFVWPVAPAGGLVPPQRSATLRLDGTRLVDVVGPVCESSDFLARERYLPPMERGDLLCVFTAGAYGMVMASQYNSRPRPAEVLIEGSAARVIRRRETYDDLVEAERLD
ncbi:MAG: diaminopimelate decarboxylase [Phycisphaerales bacterium]|nr:MAG: diaminopimelate decarboxylase [Phycisphaerales bacterium]